MQNGDNLPRPELSSKYVFPMQLNAMPLCVPMPEAPSNPLWPESSSRELNPMAKLQEERDQLGSEQEKLPLLSSGD